MFKNITNFASAMKNLAQMGPQVRAMQEKLETARVYGTSSNDSGSVHVEMSGLGVVLNVSLSQTLLTVEDKSKLEELIRQATNDANRQAREMHVSSIRDLTGGAELIPGFNDLLKNISG